MDTSPMAAPGKIDSGLSKRQRLLKPGEFSHVFKTGRRLTTRNFMVYVLRHAEAKQGGACASIAPVSRLGVSVSSASGNAVGRNKIKRLVREFFRQKRDAIFTGATADIVIAFKKSSRTTAIKDYAGIIEELRILCGRPGRLSSGPAAD